MKTPLKIQTSLFDARGQSSRLADRFIGDFRNRQRARHHSRSRRQSSVPPRQARAERRFSLFQQIIVAGDAS